MIEYERNKQNGLAEEKQAMKICVAGVGGAGSNVIDRITLDRSVDANLACFHTDVRVLSHGMAPTKVQLGGDLMKGVGAGGDPDLGREAALFSREQIRQTMQGHEIVFICTGLGGGTGSGAAPVVAEIAKSTGALVVVLATMPFSFEGRRRLNQAEEALELLQKRADALILFDNNRMGELVLPKEGIQKAFTLADQTLAQCARAVSVMVGTPGLVKLGLDDLVSALNASNGRCLFGFGEARGQNRGSDALKKALKSPLIDQGSLLQQTKNLLAHIVGGESLTLMEVDAIMKQLGRNVPEQTQILFGLAVDPKLGDAISVTLISSLGLEQLASTSKPAAIERPAPAEASKPSPAAAERKPQAARPQPAAPPPLPEPAPAPAAAEEPEEEPMELFGSAAPAPAAQSHEEEEEVRDHQQPEVVTAKAPAPAARPEPEPQEEEEEDASPFSFAAHSAVEPAREKAPAAPVIVARAQEAERKPKPASRGVLAAVLANPTTVAAAAAAPADEVVEEEAEPLFGGAATGAPAATAVAAAVKAPSSNSQQTFRLGDEDRGRFKDTEPSLSDGEDLDVPTWMRHRKKTRA